MTNIPTDLLRTFVAVVDNRSFTKAANSLGVTQPAVSAQIKRLQSLLGDDIFDRTVQGVSLTSHGEIVVSYARRLLSINDQIVHLGGGRRPELVIRIGTSSDYTLMLLPDILATFRARFPAVRFHISAGFTEPLMRQLRDGEIDLFVGLSTGEPRDAHEVWAAPLVWVRGPNIRLDPGDPVPLISSGEPSVYHRAAASALRAAGLGWEEVFVGPVMASLSGAVAAGLGVMPITRRRAIDDGMIIGDDLPLPALSHAYGGIFVREGGAREIYEQLADDIAARMGRRMPAMPGGVAGLFANKDTAA
ncbi:LysR family transcriptional regulator [Undibacter mobilis]|uniref:LysR family transcriptional regulator n=1 Tax=Undibacter mobilis TaxID=2292256 RepID=A0A371B8F8_9BRAD|nr:LysR family transcriptional regulator [Undibacter mobilis]RDV03713.1 LysR family transcriptional regulator [Undibacter mobilis]